MSKILIENGRVICPAQGIDRTSNVLIEEGRITALDAPAAEQITHSNGDLRRIDAAGKIVCPGFVDLHADLREPGWEEDETIATGTKAALAGGYTTIACSPNTDPPIDTQASVEFVQHQATRADNCNVLVIACVSKNRQGAELAEIGSLVEAGSVAFSDANRPIHNADLLRRALQYCSMFDKPIFSHPEVSELTTGGVMHEGLVSLILGLSSMPSAAEIAMASRDISLAEATGGRLHIMHVSTSGTVELVRRAKRRDVRVTAEVTPHHFCLTDESLRSFDPSFKTNPPLRAREDVEACIDGLQDGSIDVICSDHAPQAPEKKMQELDQAPFGIIGLETTLGLVTTKLVEPGHLDWTSALAKLTVNPARVLGIQKGTLEVGRDADITIFDPSEEWTVSPNRFFSKSVNTPFINWRLRGKVSDVIVGGKVKHPR